MNFKMVYYKIEAQGNSYKVVLVDSSKADTVTLTPLLSFDQCIEYIRATTPMQFNAEENEA